MKQPRKSSTADTIRYVSFILLGAAVLVFKSRYHGPLSEMVHSYAGNFFISISVYFLARIGMNLAGQGMFSAAMAALLAVELFELTNGFGVMANTFDPMDLFVNPAGIAAAMAVDRLMIPKNRF